VIACKPQTIALIQSLLYAPSTLYTRLRLQAVQVAMFCTRLEGSLRWGPMGMLVLSDDSCVGRVHHHVPCQDGAGKGTAMAMQNH